MTININKDVGSKSNITIKGLGDPGPFSFAIIKGSLPTGTTFDQATGEIKGNFTQKGDFDVTIAAKKKDRIQGSEDFTFKVTDWTLHRTDFKNLVDNNSLSWTTTGTVTKILTDPGIFDGECYEVNGSLTINLPEAIGTRDFEIDYIFKPLNNGGTDQYGRILMIGPNSTSGMFYFCRYSNTVPATILFQYCANGSTSYSNNFPNVSNPLINDDWNHILLVRKNGVLTYFLNGVREQENSFTLNMDRRELYIGANNSNTEKFYCRVKRLQIRVYDNTHFKNSTLVTDIWRYKLTERVRYFLKSTERNNYLIECNFAGNYTTRVKEGHYLPTGLTLRSNRITGNSDLTDNLSTTIELLVNGVVNDEVTINIIDIGKPYRLFELPMIGAENDIVFGDTQSRQWTRRGDVKIVKDTDNLSDLTSTYFDGSGDSLYLTDQSLVLGYDDFCLSFWLKPIAGGGNIDGRRILNYGANYVNGTFILFNDYGNPPNITFYIFDNGNWQNISAKPDKLNDEIYNHIVLARKNNVWRLLVNGKLIFEKTYVVNLTGNTVYLASNESNSVNYKGNYFDFKLSRYTLDYWDPFIPPPITRWTTAQISVTEQIGTDVRRLFKSSWPYDGVTYKVKDTSALPLGLTLEPSGLLSGTVTHEEVGETIIECYIRGVLNHTTKLVYDIMVNAKSRFLTHSIKASANSAEGLKIVKNSNSITTTSVSPTMTEVGPMLSLEYKNPYSDYNALISIPNAETLLRRKAFCIEVEIYFDGGLPVAGRNRSSTASKQPLFSKSWNTTYGAQGFYIQEVNGIFILGFESDSYIPNPLNTSVRFEFDKTKRNHFAFTYDLDKLRVFVNGKQIIAVDWPEGWSDANQALEFGRQLVNGYYGWFTAFTGFMDNINLYQGNAIYTKEFIPEINEANLYPEFPIVEPNKTYKGSLVGVNGHTVSLLTGSLPTGLTLSTDGKITGTCTVTSGDYPITLTAVKGTTIENINVNLTIAQYILDLNLNNAITNGTLTDNRGNVFTVNGTPTIQADANFASGRSIYFNGTDSYLSIPADKIFKLGRSDFVIEFDFKASTDPLPNGGSYPGIISQRANGSSQHAFSVWLATGHSQSSGHDFIPYDLNNKMSVGISTTIASSVNVEGSVECSGRGLEKNKVYKVKFVRSGTTIRLYIDDRLVESVAIHANYTFFSSNQNILIGCLDNTSITNRLFNGYLGSLRIYVPNSADLFSTSIKPENIVSWFDLQNSTSGSIVDFNSNNVWTQGVSGVVVNNGELIFNGSSHLQTTASNDWNLGSSSFTMEYEVYFDSSNNQTYQGLLNKRYGNTTRCSFTTMFNNDSSSQNYNKFLFNLNSSGSEYTSLIGEVKTPITRDNYIKISITRAYKKLYLHVDGVLAQQLDIPDGIMFWSTEDPVVLGVLNIGSKSDRYFKGKIRHFRVLKGIALYNAESYTDFKELDKPTGQLAFTPNNLANSPVVYLDGSTLDIGSDNTIRNWTDRINLHNFTVDSVAKRPTLSSNTLNGSNIASYSGTNGLFNTSKSLNRIFSGTTFMWSLAVFRKASVDSSNLNRYLFGVRTGSGYWYERFTMRVSGNTDTTRNKFILDYRDTETGAILQSISQDSLSADWVIGLHAVDFTSGKAYNVINGIVTETNIPISSGTPTSDTVGYIALGSAPIDSNNTNVNSPFAGDLATFLAGNKPITLKEMDKLVGWAAHSYDLTRLLPNDHPYKTVAPTTI